MRYHQSLPGHLESYKKNKACFGGALLRGNPKRHRPFSAHQGLHVVMRSTQAKGPRSLLRQRKKITAIVRKQAETFGVKVHNFSVNSNHLHILLRPPRDRAQFSAFMRAISGLIARTILKAQRGAAKGIKFWDKRPFSRVVPLGASFQRCARYIGLNILEALGFEGVEAAELTWPQNTAPP